MRIRTISTAPHPPHLKTVTQKAIQTLLHHSHIGKDPENVINDDLYTYFDEILGCPIVEYPPLIRYWFEKLLSCCTTRCSVVDVCVEWLKCYDSVRHMVRAEVESADALLRYEMMLSRLYDQYKQSTTTPLPSPLETVGECIQKLCWDITEATACSDEKQRDRILPLLLRCLTHAIQLLPHHRGEDLAASLLIGMAFVLPSASLREDYATAALPPLSPLMIHPDIKRDLSPSLALERSAIRIPEEMALKLSFILPETVVDVKGLECPWTTSGVTRRAAMALLRSILCIVAPNHENTESESIPSLIAQHIGHPTVITASRHFFFDTKNSKESPKKETPEQRPYHRSPSRVQATLSALSLLSFEVLDDVLPVAYSLLDDYDAVYQALGAALLIKILHENKNLGEHSSMCNEVTSLALRTVAYDDPTSLSMILLCRIECILRATPPKTQIRNLLFIIFRSISRNRHKPDILIAIFYAGILPLLSHFQGNDAMESVYEGLKGMLPLLIPDQCSTFYFTEKQRNMLLTATCLALLQLMMYGYPVISYYGGNIMTSLLHAIGHLVNQNSTEDGEAITSLLVYTASVCLIVCGGKDRRGERVEQTLSAVETYCTKPLVRRCREIRELSLSFEIKKMGV